VSVSARTIGCACGCIYGGFGMDAVKSASII